MFRKANLIFSASVFLFGSIVAYASLHFPLVDSDRSNLSASKAIEESSIPTVIQKRKQVHKECWLSTSTERLHYRIECPDSELQFVQNEAGGMELVESMNHARIWMQDRLINSPAITQEIRYLSARKARFNFFKPELETQETLVAAYRTQGHDLPLQLKEEDLYLKGRANAFVISFENSFPVVQAKDFSINFMGMSEKPIRISENLLNNSETL